MIRTAAAVILAASTGGAALQLPGDAAPAPLEAELCGVKVTLPADTRVTEATRITAGAAVAGAPGYRPSRPFCRIEGVIETEIGFELWLPERADWNRRFLGAGVGGQAGSIAVRDLARGIERGYAAASTDTGHKAADENWLLGPRERAVNYAERGNHLLAVKAKAIATAWYGEAPRKAIFIGCSGGGRQAMTQMQRFPEDYDGILAGRRASTRPR